MRYHFSDITPLIAESPEVYHRAIAQGTLDASHMFIELPDDFDFSGPSLSPVVSLMEIVSEPPEPTALELASNFAAAIGRWSSAGFKVVTEAQHSQRAAICDGCEFWNGRARLGLGKCEAPGCGCTRFKRWLATEKCPKSKWPELT